MQKLSKEQKHAMDLALRNLLKLDYEKRINTNPAFSLRAFAKKLDIQQSLLSKLLQGKRGFSPALAEKITNFLGVAKSQIIENTEVEFQATQYSFIDEDEFLTLSHWSNFAVIETLKLKGSEHTPAYISEKLELPQTQVQFILERLERLGYIKKVKNKFEVQKTSTHWLSKEKTSAARKKYQKDLLEKAINCIEELDFNQRDNSSLLFAFDSELMPEIKERITKFRRSLDKFVMENSKNYDQVYNLSVALFPLSKNEIKENKKTKIKGESK